jgi:hypothetical protein
MRGMSLLREILHVYTITIPAISTLRRHLNQGQNDTQQGFGIIQALVKVVEIVNLIQDILGRFNGRFGRINGNGQGSSVMKHPIGILQRQPN